MGKRGLIVVSAVLVLTAGVVAPDAAWAQRSRGGMVSGGGRSFVGGGGRVVVNGGGRVIVGGGGRAVVTHPGLGHHPFIARPFVRPFARPFVRPFFPFAPAVVYAAPPAYYPAPAYYPPAYYDPSASYDAPASYSPPVSYAPPSSAISVAPAPPTPNVVEFATGRYELRGDGVSAPYTWVWIPNPPPAAPPAAPTAPPAGEPTSGRSQAPARVGHLYRWTDGHVVVYWTDRLDAVPEQYRSRAKQTTSS